MCQVTWKSLLITQPLLPRFTSRRHPNPKSKTTNSADYLFCQTVRKATSKSLKAHQLAPRFMSLRHLNRKTKMAASKWPCLSDIASSDSEIMPSTAAGAPIYVSSSSESDDQDSGALLPGRKPYSIGLQELPASLREFLGEAYAFFTSSHRLERAGQRVSLTTYGKAQERILCEYCLFISLKYDSERNVAQTRVCLLKLE